MDQNKPVDVEMLLIEELERIRTTDEKRYWRIINKIKRIVYDN